MASLVANPFQTGWIYKDGSFLKQKSEVNLLVFFQWLETQKSFKDVNK